MIENFLETYKISEDYLYWWVLLLFTFLDWLGSLKMSSLEKKLAQDISVQFSQDVMDSALNGSSMKGKTIFQDYLKGIYMLKGNSYSHCACLAAKYEPGIRQRANGRGFESRKVFQILNFRP